VHKEYWADRNPVLKIGRKQGLELPKYRGKSRDREMISLATSRRDLSTRQSL
jgi:hypothetical protein